GDKGISTNEVHLQGQDAEQQVAVSGRAGRGGRRHRRSPAQGSWKLATSSETLAFQLSPYVVFTVNGSGQALAVTSSERGEFSRAAGRWSRLGFSPPGPYTTTI